MVMVVTYGLCTNERNVHDARGIALVLDTPAYNEAQPITTITLVSPMIISRVNRIERTPDNILIVHIA